MKHRLPYRSFLAVLALLIVAGAGAEASPSGEGTALRAAATHACCPGHAASERCPMAPDEDGTGEETPAEMPMEHPAGGAMACCSSAPVAPAAAAVVPSVTVTDGPSFVTVARLPQPRFVSVPLRALDTGPPASSLRSHLALSVLLI